MKILGGALVIGSLALASLVSAQSNTPTERFTAAAINTNNGAAGSVEFVVNRWSTDAERDRLLETLIDKGPDKLLDTLQDMPRLGFIRATNGGLGYDLRYARKEKGEDGGERIVLATDRRIGFWEASRQPRSIDYPFTVIEMHLNGDGEGEGKLSLATKITASKDKHTVILENYELQPVMLKSIKRERSASR